MELQEQLDQANAIKLFYYESWEASEKIIRELKDLIEHAGLDESNPPLYNKIMAIMYGEEDESI